MLQDDIARNLTIETLVAATAVGATITDDTWIDIGDPIRMTMDNRLILYYDLVVNDSTGVQVRFLPVKTESGNIYLGIESYIYTDSSNINLLCQGQFLGDSRS